MADGTCAVEGCENYGPLKRTWCSTHYHRWRRSGGSPPPPAQQGGYHPFRACMAEGCDREHYGKGYCTKHYQRFKRNGHTNVLAHARWLGDEATYGAVHHRLRASRGRAAEHICDHCGGPAADWAYDGTCPDEKRWLHHGAMLAYSTDLDRYMPLCRACHSRFDENAPDWHARIPQGSANVGAAST